MTGWAVAAGLLSGAATLIRPIALLWFVRWRSSSPRGRGERRSPSRLPVSFCQEPDRAVKPACHRCSDHQLDRRREPSSSFAASGALVVADSHPVSDFFGVAAANRLFFETPRLEGTAGPAGIRGDATRRPRTAPPSARGACTALLATGDAHTAPPYSGDDRVGLQRLDRDIHRTVPIPARQHRNCHRVVRLRRRLHWAWQLERTFRILSIVTVCYFTLMAAGPEAEIRFSIAFAPAYAIAFGAGITRISEYIVRRAREARAPRIRLAGSRQKRMARTSSGP